MVKAFLIFLAFLLVSCAQIETKKEPVISDQWKELTAQGISFYRRGNYSAAAQLFETSLDLAEKAFGLDHPNTAISLTNLGRVCQIQHKYEEAESLYRRSLAIWEKGLGKDSPNVAQSLSNLADLYEAQDKCVEAEPLYRRSLSIWEKALGRDHPQLSIMLEKMAQCYEDMGKPEEAKRYRVRTIEYVPQPVIDGIEQLSEARIDFTGFEIVARDNSAEFIISLAHPLSQLDCLSFPMSSGPSSNSTLINIGLLRYEGGRRVERQVYLAPDGVVYIPKPFRGPGRIQIDEKISQWLNWTEDAEGRIHLELPWELIPLDENCHAVAMASTYRIMVSKYVNDTWASLNQRYQGKFEINDPNGNFEVRGGQLYYKGVLLNGELGHYPEICRYGSRQESWDSIPGPPGATLLESAMKAKAVVFQHPDQPACEELKKLSAPKINLKELYALDAPNAYIAFSPDGKILATATRYANPDIPGELKLWDMVTGKEIAQLIGHTGGILSVAFSPDGKTLATGGSDKLVYLWDVDKKELRFLIKGHSSQILETVFSPDGKTLATSTGTDATLGYTADSNEIRMWHVDTGKELPATLRFEGPFIHSDIYSLAFSSKDPLMATGSVHVLASGNGMPGRVTLWNLETGQSKTIHEDPPGAILAVAFSPDGKLLATGGFTGMLRLWDVETGLQLRAMPRQRNWIYTLAFSPDGKLLATGTRNTRTPWSPGEIKLWNTDTGDELSMIYGRGHGVISVMFSPDGRKMAAGFVDGKVKVWEMIKAY